MNSSENLPADPKTKLELFIVKRQKLFYSHIVSEVLFWVGMVGVGISGRLVIAKTNSELYSAVLSVSITVIGILFFALLTLQERSVRRKEVFKLLKTRHPDFFDWVNSNVARLIEKSRTDEGLVTRSSQ